MKREALIVSLLLLVAGYLVGAMFSGWDTMEWSRLAASSFNVWFFVCAIIGLFIAYGDGM